MQKLLFNGQRMFSSIQMTIQNHHVNFLETLEKKELSTVSHQLRRVSIRFVAMERSLLSQSSAIPPYHVRVLAAYPLKEVKVAHVLRWVEGYCNFPVIEDCPSSIFQHMGNIMATMSGSAHVTNNCHELVSCITDGAQLRSIILPQRM